MPVLLQGVLHLSKRSSNEGTVQLGSQGPALLRQVAVRGKAALNRAMHGDTVAGICIAVSYLAFRTAVLDAAAYECDFGNRKCKIVKYSGDSVSVKILHHMLIANISSSKGQAERGFLYQLCMTLPSGGSERCQGECPTL